MAYSSVASRKSSATGLSAIPPAMMRFTCVFGVKRVPRTSIVTRPVLPPVFGLRPVSPNPTTVAVMVKLAVAAAPNRLCAST